MGVAESCVYDLVRSNQLENLSPVDGHLAHVVKVVGIRNGHLFGWGLSAPDVLSGRQKKTDQQNLMPGVFQKSVLTRQAV